MVHSSTAPSLPASSSGSTLMGPPPVPNTAHRPRLAPASLAPADISGAGPSRLNGHRHGPGHAPHRGNNSQAEDAAGENDDDDEAMSDDEDYAPGSSRQSNTNGKRGSTGSAKGQAAAMGGAAPGKTGMSRQSREARRKANHSLIERRRREKINSALAELRNMVPGLSDEKGGKAGEFKLEVLERTVEHLKELKEQVAELQSQLTHNPPVHSHLHSHPSSEPTRKKPRPSHVKKEDPTHKSSDSPPTPSLSPESPRPVPSSPGDDSDSTELDPSLPPAVSSMSTTQHFRPSPASMAAAAAVGSGPFANGAPTVASLLSGGSPPKHSHPHQAHQLPAARPSPSASANNPTLYLPFPTPSPTSPFLTYGHGQHAAQGGNTIEPSPFLAPIKDLGLFGGAVTLSLGEGLSPAIDAREKRTASVTALRVDMPPPEGSRASSASSNDSGPAPASRPKGEKRRHHQSEPSPEEAANLLLAFSSPDSLRPVGSAPSSLVAAGAGGIKRRNTLDDWSLDSQAPGKLATPKEGKVEGKSASDILKL